MKKLSLILVVVTLLAISLIGATAFATSLAETEGDVYIGEYAHNNQNSTDKEVVIVFGTASTDEQAGITERGVVLTDGTEYLYYRAWRWDKETGKFGVAIIRSTVESGDYVAHAYAKVGGTYDETEKIVLGYDDISVGQAVDLNFAATLTKTVNELEVSSAQSIDLKDYIELEDGSKDELKYAVSTQNGEITVSADGIVSYGNKAGRYTATATHALTNQSVTFDIIAYDEVYEISEVSQLTTLNAEHSNSYVKLMTDLTVDTADMVVETSPNANSGKGDGAYVIGGVFNGVFDGQQNKITYNFDYNDCDSIFRGLFKTIAGTLKNLQVEATALQKNDYGVYLTDSMGSNALVENCYVDVTLIQNASASGNNTSTHFVVCSSSGRVENIIFNMRANMKNDSESVARGIGLQEYGTGKWTNIAYISTDFVKSWRGGMFASLMGSEQLNNVVYYKSMARLFANIGSTIGVGSSDYTYTAITEEQTMGTAWTIDRTECSESIALNGEEIWKMSTVEVTDEADFISKMNSATETDVIKLTKDLSFETSDFTVETEENGETTYKYDTYLVETFKGTLFGDGYSITYDLSPVSTADTRVRGLIERVDLGARVVGVKFVGTVDLTWSFQSAFVEENYGIFDKCYIDVKAIAIDFDGNTINAIGLFGRNDSYIQNCVILSDSRRSNQTDWQGMKIVHNGSNSTTGRFVNVALVQTARRIGSRNNANDRDYLLNVQLDNVVHYYSITELFDGTAPGSLVQNVDNNTTYEYTALTGAQSFGSALMVDYTGVKFANGKYLHKRLVEISTKEQFLVLEPLVQAIMLC